MSTSIIVQIINPFNGRTDEEKETIAEKLLNAIEEKETPEEMLKAAQALNLQTTPQKNPKQHSVLQRISATPMQRQTTL